MKNAMSFSDKRRSARHTFLKYFPQKISGGGEKLFLREEGECIDNRGWRSDKIYVMIFDVLE